MSVVVGAGEGSAFVCRIFVPVAYEGVPSVCVVPVPPVDTGEGPADVPGVFVARVGGGVPWVLMSTAGFAGEAVMTLGVVSASCTVGEDGMTDVGTADILETVVVELRSVMVIGEPLGPLDVEMTVVGVEAGVPVLAEDAVMAGLILGVPMVEGAGLLLMWLCFLQGRCLKK